MMRQGPLAFAVAVILLALLPLAGAARPSGAPPVWESRIQQHQAQPGSGGLVPELRNRAGAPGESYQYTTRVVAPTGQVNSALDIVSGSAWTSRPYPTNFEGAPVLMAGTYSFEFIVAEAVVRRDQVTVGAVTPYSTSCAGDELISFNPASPIQNQQLSIIATSSRPSANVALTGPGNPQFAGSSPGGRGTNWTYRVTLTQPGQYGYSFLVDNATCATGTVTVGANQAPPPNAFWQLEYPRTVRLSETTSFEMRIRNRDGVAGQQTPVTVVVATPQGPAYSTRITVVADQWASVRYPFNFPQAPPLQVGTYRIEFRSANEVAVAKDSIQVVQ